MTTGNFTRRGFVKGALAAGFGAAACGMAGCAPSLPETGEEGGAPSSGATQGTTPTNGSTFASQLNPQDYDYTSHDGELSTLFSAWQLGPLTIPNRMVKSAAGSRTAMNGTQAYVDFYTNIAKGGVGMVWVENFTSLLPDYLNGDKQDLDEWEVQALVDSVHEAGAYVGYQFDTMAMTLLDGYADAQGFGPGKPEALSIDDIHWYQDQVIKGARRLKDYGFDGFEINAAGNNIPRTFLSRMTNHREPGDDYGPGSIESRARFVVEMIEGIKKECGDDFVVQVLINGVEENDENIGRNELCTTVAENKEFAKLFEQAGADSLHVRLGPIGNHTAQFLSEAMFDGIGIEGSTSYGTQFDFTKHYGGKLVANHSGCGLMLDVAQEIKSAVSIPVGAVTYMDPAHAPDFFEQALKDGKVDFLMMNRPLSVDFDYVTKLQEGRTDEIRPCTRCLHCLRDQSFEGGMSSICRVNATTARAFSPEMPEGFEPAPVASAKNVLVVGGGPAGMEAARIAAQRGHNVTLMEKGGSLGGKLTFASAIKGPHQNLSEFSAWMARQLELQGVNVQLNTEATADSIAAEAPDVVVCATGGKRVSSGLSSTGATNVVPIDDIMSAEIGDNVVVLGANAQAFDIAQYYQAQGKTVSMVFEDPIEGFDKGQSTEVKGFVTPMYYAVGGTVYPSSTVKQVGDGSIVIAAGYGVDVEIPCDTVIEALDVAANTDVIKGLSVETYAVGDCNEPWTSSFANILTAVSEGNLVGRAI